MRKHAILWVYAASILMAGALGLATASAALPSEGQYICRGEIAGKKPYEYDLTVAKGMDPKMKDLYFFTWTKFGSMAASGQGIEQDGYFSVLFVDAKGGLGLAMYHFRPGRLDGRWTGGDGEVHTEICTRGSEL